MAHLTAEELLALPDETLVTITWSGGNGPHRYVLRWYYDDDLYAYIEGQPDLDVGLVISRSIGWTVHRVSLVPATTC